jgi:hypothetical protein
MDAVIPERLIFAKSRRPPEPTSPIPRWLPLLALLLTALAMGIFAWTLLQAPASRAPLKRAPAQAPAREMPAERPVRTLDPELVS